MTYYLFNNKRQSVDVLFTAANTLTISGNDSVSNIAIANQTVLGASIKQMWCASISGNSAFWTISRGSNDIFYPDSTAYLDFSGNGAGLNLFPDATIVVSITGGSGSLMLTLRKNPEMPDNSTY